MSILIDTSAILAILDEGDTRHASADAVWHALLASDDVLVCTSYAQLETYALAQSRFGIEVVRTLDQQVFPALTIEWVGQADHRAGVSAVLAAGRRQLSLVDCVSFHVMRRLGIRRAFAFDPHFADHGFECVPAVV